MGTRWLSQTPLPARPPLKKKKRNVIERYVIDYFERRKVVSKRHFCLKKRIEEEREPLLIKNSAQRGNQKLKLEACLA